MMMTAPMKAQREGERAGCAKFKSIEGSQGQKDGNEKKLEFEY